MLFCFTDGNETWKPPRFIATNVIATNVRDISMYTYMRNGSDAVAGLRLRSAAESTAPMSHPE